MVHGSVFKKLFLLLPLAYPPASNDVDNTDNNETIEHWNYETQGNNWPGTCASGVRQSPIQLALQKSVVLPLPRIIFHNYDVMLKGPLTLVNNGHSVHMDVPVTRNGQKPYITGGLLKSRYVTEGIHFHWGSPWSRGSEHTINKNRYDVECHIVHRNEKYADLTEAVEHSDGIAVLGVMMKIVKNSDRFYPGLSKVFAQVPNVVDYEAESVLKGSITLGQILGDLNTRNFYTYKGSLTTPGCAEAVTWMVFPQPLQVPYSLLSKLWDVKDEYGDKIQNNYRLTQPLNNRLVIYRAKDFGGLFK